MNKIEAKIEELEIQIQELRSQHDSLALPKMVKISDRSYLVSETPITVAQYQFFCNETKRQMPEQPNPQCPTNPVVNVTWHDAHDYTLWLTTKTKEHYSLPSEDTFEHFWGNHREANATIAVYNKNEIQPVRTKEANNYGIYDVLGLVWEWQEDSYV